MVKSIFNTNLFEAQAFKVFEREKKNQKKKKKSLHRVHLSQVGIIESV